jgi:hypothetical protein
MSFFEEKEEEIKKKTTIHIISSFNFDWLKIIKYLLYILYIKYFIFYSSKNIIKGKIRKRELKFS